MHIRTWITESPDPVRHHAERIGVHRVTLHKYMAGKLMPTPPVIARIVRHTRGAVTADDLAAGYRAQ